MIDFDREENYDAFVEYLSKERACFQAIFFSDFMGALRKNCHKFHDDQIGFMARYFEDAGVHLVKKLYENIKKQEGHGKRASHSDDPLSGGEKGKGRVHQGE